MTAKETRSKPRSKSKGPPPARLADPEQLAQMFVHDNQHAGLPTIIRWRGEWFKHFAGRYIPVSDEDIRAGLVQSIKAGYSRVTQTVINNAYIHCLSELALPSTREPHNWIMQPRPTGEFVCFQNAIVDLKCALKPDYVPLDATPGFFGLNAIEADYVPFQDVSEPVHWLNFLDQVFASDEERQALKEWFGYCLTQRTCQHKIMFLLGPKRSGKGTIARTLTSLVGRFNVAGPTLSSLDQNFGLQPLIGKQLAIVADARLSNRSHSAVIAERLLSISGEDTLTIDRKYQVPWTGILKTRFMILSNELPRLSDASGALASRLIVLRTPTSFFGREDHHLMEKLQAELPAIFWWAVHGFHDVDQAGRLFTPKSSFDQVRAMELLSSPLKSFIEDRCEITNEPEHWVSKDELFRAYTSWCLEEGISHASSKAVFVRDFNSAADHRVTEGRITDNLGCRIRVFIGIKVS